jgi:hypothetical protein
MGIRIKKYKTALKTIQKYNPKKIELLIKDKKFEGVLFKIDNSGEKIDRWGNVYFVDVYYDNNWLLINTKLENPLILDAEFVGSTFELYGETRGDDFIFMGIHERTSRKPPNCSVIEI